MRVRTEDIAPAAAVGRSLDRQGRLETPAGGHLGGRQQGDIVPSLDGASVVNLAVQTRTMSVGDMADLITFAQAWAVENGVRLNEPRYRDYGEQPRRVA